MVMLWVSRSDAGGCRVDARGCKGMQGDVRGTYDIRFCDTGR